MIGQCRNVHEIVRTGLESRRLYPSPGVISTMMLLEVPAYVATSVDVGCALEKSSVVIIRRHFRSGW